MAIKTNENFTPFCNSVTFRKPRGTDLATASELRPGFCQSKSNVPTPGSLCTIKSPKGCQASNPRPLSALPHPPTGFTLIGALPFHVYLKRNSDINIVKRSHLLSSHPQHFISFNFNLITLFYLYFDLKTTLHRVFDETFLNCYIFSLTRIDKKWFLHDWSGKALDADSRYFINQVSIRIFYVLKIVICVLKMLFYVSASIRLA